MPPVFHAENLRVWSSILRGGITFSVAKSLCYKDLAMDYLFKRRPKHISNC